MTPIKLKCLGCGNSMDYERDIDPDIPAEVATIEQGMCNKCWNGDFDSETWRDAQGNEIPQSADPVS